ncbi:MAG: hypothetical protein EBY56_03035 [Actinobacteria bacterium]|nr:hypothetical protein [Actinomycetota bacterium]
MTDTQERPQRAHSTLSSVANAARLLKEFSKGNRELGVTELSRRLGVGKSTAHRLVNTLTEERLLEQDPDTGARCPLHQHRQAATGMPICRRTRYKASRLATSLENPTHHHHYRRPAPRAARHPRTGLGSEHQRGRDGCWVCGSTRAQWFRRRGRGRLYRRTGAAPRRRITQALRTPLH